MTAEIINLPLLRTIHDDLLLCKFNDHAWLEHEAMMIEINGRLHDHEEVYWELHRRGIAPPI